MESYASMSIMRGATRELYYMSDPSYELSQAYRTAVAVVVGCGGRVMAFHRYVPKILILVVKQDESSRSMFNFWLSFLVKTKKLIALLQPIIIFGMIEKVTTTMLFHAPPPHSSTSCPPIKTLRSGYTSLTTPQDSGISVTWPTALVRTLWWLSLPFGLRLGTAGIDGILGGDVFSARQQAIPRDLEVRYGLSKNSTDVSIFFFSIFTNLFPTSRWPTRLEITWAHAILTSLSICRTARYIFVRFFTCKYRGFWRFQFSFKLDKIIYPSSKTSYGVYWMLQPTVQTVTSIATTAKTNADFPNLDDFVVSELKAACKSVGDLIATDIENWLDAFTEFRSSKGAYFKDFTAHWQHMQSKWAVSNWDGGG